MRDDYTYEGTPVSKMSTADINACLADGIVIEESEHGVTADDILERLRIELYIRSVEGRL